MSPAVSKLRGGAADRLDRSPGRHRADRGLGGGGERPGDAGQHRRVERRAVGAEIADRARACRCWMPRPIARRRAACGRRRSSPAANCCADSRTRPRMSLERPLVGQVAGEVGKAVGAGGERCRSPSGPTRRRSVKLSLKLALASKRGATTSNAAGGAVEAVERHRSVDLRPARHDRDRDVGAQLLGRGSDRGSSAGWRAPRGP